MLRHEEIPFRVAWRHFHLRNLYLFFASLPVRLLLVMRAPIHTMAAFLNASPVRHVIPRTSSASAPWCVPKCTISDRPPSPRAIRDYANSNNKSKGNSGGFELVSETLSYKRYQTVHERLVRYPDGREVSFDVVGTASRSSVFVFPYNTTTRTATLLREYSPGIHGLTYGFVAGMYEPNKHASVEAAAYDELSEEAHLKHGTLIALNSSEISTDKYSTNSFNFFLSLDACRDEKPKNRDAEEFIEIYENIDVNQIGNMVKQGMFNTPSSLLALLAIDELRKRNLV